MLIEDGKGSGRTAAVTLENNLSTASITRPLQHHINHEEQQCYSIVLGTIASPGITPTGPGDCFCYILNNNSNDLILTSVKFGCASDETLAIIINDTISSITGTHSDLTLVNRHGGSGNIADATAEYGVDIQGLSGGSIIDLLFVNGGDSMRKFVFTSSVIIPKNKILSFYVDTGTALCYFSASIHFHSVENGF